VESGLTYTKADDNGEIDIEAHRQVARGTIRGLFFQHVVSECEGKNVALPPKRYVAFRENPMVDFIDLIVDAAPKLYPGRPLRGALRDLGASVYPMFIETTLGRVMRAFTGRSYRQVIEAAPRAFAAATSDATVVVQDLTNTSGVIVARHLPVFPESYLIGVWEGAMLPCDCAGSVEVALPAPNEVHFKITWRPLG